LFAVQESVYEGLGFSPFQLLFDHVTFEIVEEGLVDWRYNHRCYHPSDQRAPSIIAG